MSRPLPDETHRWRCHGCGNLTRFDVTRSRRTTEYWHLTWPASLGWRSPCC
ncbi:MAG: hypothetical protein R2731_16715 [Nocardioides sp.]